jgi:D-Ala-D-Ala carboxypeptidase 3 (S13) family
MRGASIALALLLGACTSDLVPPPPPATTPAGPTAPSPPSAVPQIDPGRPRLELVVDARPIRPGGCAPATASVSSGRVGIRLEVRSGGGRWAPWPVGPERTTHRGTARLRLCPGWSADPLEVRAVAAGARPSAAELVHVRPAPWMRDLEALIGDRPVSVSVMTDRAFVYGHLADTRRTPASNEKLLLSMALLDRFGPDERLSTEAAIRGRLRDDGVVEGALFLRGTGDPELDAEDLGRLAGRLVAAGLRRVAGSVVGDTETFVRDRAAPGWHPIALRYVGLPTALSFEGNVDTGGYVFDPERRAAAVLTTALRSLGVTIRDPSRATDAVPNVLRPIASVRSAPLGEILRRQNVSSDNQAAETLSKMLATDVLGRGSIANGARVIQHRANALEAGVRAKTGTLIGDISALSGYVRIRDGTWASFSIMSELPKGEAVALEDAIVRILADAQR